MKRLSFATRQIENHNLINEFLDCHEDLRVFRPKELVSEPYYMLNPKELGFIRK